jgi:hypothetical protein
VAELWEDWMKKLLLAGIGAVSLFGGAALGSDLPTKAPSPQIPMAAPFYKVRILFGH